MDARPFGVGSMTLDLSRTALVVVDAQCGFTALCPDELPVPGGVEIVPAINDLLMLPFGRIDATQDWHPADHCSFLGRRDNLYPPHCVIGTPGADFLPGLRTDRIHTVWRKGFQKDLEAYAVTAQHPAFLETLRYSGIKHVLICGIATNICCYFTARDLRRGGLDVWMIEDASAGIDVPAAGLYQTKAKEDGMAIGIRYAKAGDVK
jgi:nicotinamidase/pyrazinamidase